METKKNKTTKADRFLFGLILTLVVSGFVIFSSAALGQIGRTGASFSTVALKQLFILCTGFLMMVIASNIPYKTWRKYSPVLFLVGLILTSLVFVPDLGFGAGGAKRWLNLQFTTFQPSEFLKFSFVIFLAAWISARKEKIRSLKEGFLPFLIFLGTIGFLLIKQPDTGTFMVIVSAALGIFIVGGGKWSHILSIFILGISMVIILALTRQYVMDRLTTFLRPGEDSLGTSWQINQSLIAIGSGGLLGRGFGQSIQKFNFLPEPIGDSIFAVAGEEFGFIGSSLLICLFMLFGLWGLKIAGQTKDPFGRLLGVGFVILITAQSFINIGAMIGLLPLTGVPLSFISHGGTALFFSLIEVGIILNISRQKN